jgi:DNA-binding response OmpR family regulator
MRAVFIGVAARTRDIAALGVRLRWPDVALEVATTATHGLELVQQAPPDVVLLHPDFSDQSIPSTIQQIRHVTNVPLMVIGHLGDSMEAVTSLESGADDYVRLPCDLTEFTARIWALLRRAGIAVTYDGSSPMRCGHLYLNPATYEAFLGSRRVILTSTEFRLLCLLVKNWGIVVSHQSLERALWGDQPEFTGLVKKYVQRLRRKLQDDAREPYWIANVHGIGYRFIGPAPEAQEKAGPQLASTAD